MEKVKLEIRNYGHVLIFVPSLINNCRNIVILPNPGNPSITLK